MTDDKTWRRLRFLVWLDTFIMWSFRVVAVGMAISVVIFAAMGHFLFAGAWLFIALFSWWMSRREPPSLIEIEETEEGS